jgi:hypothetical protein
MTDMLDDKIRRFSLHEKSGLSSFENLPLDHTVWVGIREAKVLRGGQRV